MNTQGSGFQNTTLAQTARNALNNRVDKPCKINLFTRMNGGRLQG